MYLTRREAEFYGLPVGNPFGGAAYGKKEMPFVGLFAAVGTAFAAVGTAVGVGATLAAVGTAAVATVTAVGAVAAVAGVGMSVVGMATGNKDLTHLGMTVGLAGGLAFMGGSAIASMGIGGGAFSMGTTALEAANGTIAAGQATAVAASEAAAGTLLPAATNVMADGAADVAMNAEFAAHGSGLGALGTAGTPTASGLSTGVLASPIAGGTAPLMSPLNAGATTLTNGVLTSAPASTGASTNFFSGLLDGMSGSDKAATIMLGSSLLKGLGGASESDQLARDKFNQDTAVHNQRVKNLNSIPTMTFKGSEPYTPAATTRERMSAAGMLS